MNFEDLVKQVGDITDPTFKVKGIITLIRNKVKTYVEANGLQSLVVGISGGLDSAVVAALCQEEYTGVPLIGVSIPMNSTDAHVEQAKWVGDSFCTSFDTFFGWDETFDPEDGKEMYTDAHEDIFNRLEGTDDIAIKAGFKAKSFPKPILQGNMKARLRMMTLYDLARKSNGLVLSTDNMSEFLLGFWTLNGDVGNYSPIQNIWKGLEMPVIAMELGIRDDIIKQSPSDGLSVTKDNTDEAQLGANYKEADTILSIYLGKLPVCPEELSRLKVELFNLVNTDIDAAKKVSKIISRYENLAFKRNGTIELQRDEIGLKLF